MAAEIITKEDLQVFRSQLLEDIKTLLFQKIQSSEKKWLRSKEVRKLLNISPGTLQTLRINGKLSPTKIGGIMYYKTDEIHKLLGGELS